MMTAQSLVFVYLHALAIDSKGFAFFFCDEEQQEITTSIAFQCCTTNEKPFV